MKTAIIFLMISLTALTVLWRTGQLEIRSRDIASHQAGNESYCFDSSGEIFLSTGSNDGRCLWDSPTASR